ncbi:MAG: hypothetical protein ACRDJU_05055 [Actinomycetota bacterium]
MLIATKEVMGMEEVRAMTVRLTAEQASELEAVAQIEGAPVSEEIRKAIAVHIEGKKNDAAFQERLRRSIERNQAILKKLAR